MPNTAAILEKYPGYRATGYSFSAGGVGLYNDQYEDALTLVGWTYSSVNQEKYDVSIALLKDVLDAESATAFIGWLEEQNELELADGEAYDNYGKNSPERESTKAALKEHLAPLKADFVTFGNVKVKWQTEGSVINLIIKNK
jgi:hypothetical protein